MNAFELRQVSKRHQNGFEALRGVNLAVPQGSLTTLLGPSGCGKSTLLRLMAGLDQPTSGEIWMHGSNVTHQSLCERNVSLVFQNCALFPHLTVLGNVSFGLRMLGLSQTAQRLRAREALALVGLPEMADRSTALLSGGQQQRVALARALAPQPAVLLLDEPLSNLDTRLRRSMRDEIRQLQQRLALTVVYVTHDQSEAMAVSDQVVVMRDGEVLQVGTPQGLYNRPQNETVAAFMGDAAIVDLELDHPVNAETRSQSGESAPCDSAMAVSLKFGSVSMSLCVPRAWIQADGRVRLMVRPEAWQLRPASNGGVPGKILSAAYLGRITEYMVEVPWGELLVTALGVVTPLQVGAPVSLNLKPGLSQRDASPSSGVSALMPSQVVSVSAGLASDSVPLPPCRQLAQPASMFDQTTTETSCR
jgi:iron(III) transport system ATP-binding protein